VLADLETLFGPPEDLDDGDLSDRVEWSDLEALQGSWRAVTGRRQGVLLVSGTHFTVRFEDGDIYMGSFDLGAALQPRVIDMRIDEGPSHHRGKTALCIYDLDGDVLRWCATEPGRTERLTFFPAEDDRRFLTLLFRRESLP
jgi:uncharacterized protein (TIGR03067 family)